MGEAMAELFLAYQLALTSQSLTYRLVGLVHMNARKLASRTGVGTISLNHVQRADSIMFANHEVFHTVIRRSMNRTGTRFDRHVVTENRGHLLVVNGMMQGQILKICTQTI